MSDRLRPQVDAGLEARFRAGYCRGWVGAADALAQLCERRGLTAEQAAALLGAHKRDALDRWAGTQLQAGLYPPRVSVRQVR